MNDGREKEREGPWEIGKGKPRKGEREREGGGGKE